MRQARIVAIGAAVAMFAGAGTAQVLAQRNASGTPSDDRPPVVSASITANGTSGAVWFCPLVAGTEDNAAASLRISRSGSDAGTAGPTATARITLYGPAGVLGTSSSSINAGAVQVSVSSVLRSTDTATLPSIAATVESNDPSIVVESSLGARSSSFLPCSTGVSARWFVPVGSTKLQHSTDLALFNPFPGTALVDLSFWSERGAARPTALQGVAVPGNSLRIIELGDFVRRRERLATEVSVRSGRIVAATNHRYSGSSELSMGVPEPSTQWFVPRAVWSEKRPETFTFLNSTDTDATVEITATLAADDVEPFELLVPAASSAVFDASADGRIPADTSYAFVAQVTDGPPLVMARSVNPASGSGSGSGAGARHFSESASAVAASQWSVPVADSASVTVFNPYDVPATVQLSSPAAGSATTADTKPFTLGAGAFRTLTVTDGQRSAGQLTVTATGAPVVVSGLTGNGVGVAAVPVIDR